jgi:hypothetical protein
MATFFDISLLGHFSIIFTFLLVFALVYAMLTYLKLFGDNKPIHAIVALSAALLMIFSQRAVMLVTTMVPWFMILLIVGIFGIIGYKLFAGPDVDLSVLHGSPGLRSWVIAAITVVFIIALSQQFGQDIGPYLGQDNASQQEAELEPGETASTATGTFTENLTATLFHPKILGMIVLILVATFSVLFLAQKVQG